MFACHPIVYPAMRFYSGGIGWTFPTVHTTPFSGSLPPKPAYTCAKILKNPPRHAICAPQPCLGIRLCLSHTASLPPPLLPLWVCLPRTLGLYLRRNQTSRSRPVGTAKPLHPASASTATLSPPQFQPLPPPQNPPRTRLYSWDPW